MTAIEGPSLPSSVLVPLDGSAYADRAVPVAVALAAALGGDVRLLGIADGDDADRLRDHLASVASSAAPGAAFEVRPGTAAEEIAAGATEPPSIVCLASHGRGRLASALLGSTATAIVARSAWPVVVVGPAVSEVPAGQGARMVACVDGSSGSEEVLGVASAWASRLDLPLTVTTVAEPVPPVSDDEHRFSRRFGPDTNAEAYVAGLAEALGDRADAVAVYDPISVHEGLVGHLRERPATLVALTTHARTGVRRAVLGSVAGRIVQESPAPVLLVPLQRDAS